MNRASIANNKRLKSFLDRDTFGDAISKHFMPLEDWDKLDKLDRAVIAKMAWWFHSYVEKLLSLPKDREHLTAQFVLITAITAVEATVGEERPKKYRYDWQRIYAFYEHNLTDTQKKELLDGFEWHDQKPSLAKVIRELVFRRHGLLHRANLPNLPGEDIIGVLAYGNDFRGRTRGVVDIRLKPNQLSSITKQAILNYIKTKPANRIPVQDLRR